MEIKTVINDPVYTECWNCSHKEWWDYANPDKTKPRICPKCGERFMSKMDKELIDTFWEKV